MECSREQQCMELGAPAQDESAEHAERAEDQDREGPRVVLLPVSPFRAHAYWDISSTDLEHFVTTFRGEGASPELILRLHEATDMVCEGETGPGHIDVPIEPRADCCYIESCHPGSSYRAELGVVREDGGFAALSGSNVVRMPFAAPASKGERSRGPAGEHRGLDEAGPVVVNEVPSPRSQPPSAPASTEGPEAVSEDEKPRPRMIPETGAGMPHAAMADYAAQTDEELKAMIESLALAMAQLPKTLAPHEIPEMAGMAGTAGIKGADEMEDRHGISLPSKFHVPEIFKLESTPRGGFGTFPPDKSEVMLSRIALGDAAPDLTEMSERRFLQGISSWWVKNE